MDLSPEILLNIFEMEPKKLTAAANRTCPEFMFIGKNAMVGSFSKCLSCRIVGVSFQCIANILFYSKRANNNDKNNVKTKKPVKYETTERK